MIRFNADTLVGRRVVVTEVGLLEVTALLTELEPSTVDRKTFERLLHASKQSKIMLL